MKTLLSKLAKTSRLFIQISAITVVTAFVAEDAYAMNETDLFFGDRQYKPREAGLWKWAANRPINFLAFEKRTDNSQLAMLERAIDPEVEMIARSLLTPRQQFLEHVDIGYGLPGNLVVVFHDELTGALVTQHKFFEGGKDKISAWPRWDEVFQRINDKDKEHCVYRISYHKNQIYGGYIFVNNQQPKPLQINCIATVLLMALGAKFISPELFKEQPQAFFDDVLKIYDRKFPPGMSKTEFVQMR